MNHFKVWMPLLGAISLATVLGFTLMDGGNPTAVASPLTGKPSPALDLPTLGGEGPRLTIEQMKGKPYLLNFFASWCGPCAEENPMLVSLAGKHEIDIIGLAMKDDPDMLKAYLAKRGNPYTRIGMDDSGRTAIDWGVSGVPETFAINAQGNIVDKHIGALTEDDVQRLLKALQVVPQ